MSGAKTGLGALPRGALTAAAVVALVLAGRQFLSDRMRNAPASAAGGQSGETAAVPVATVRAVTRDFAELATIQGTVLAREFAIVSARREGLLTAIPVREGDPVRKDETVLFTMDDRVYRENMEAAERQLDVAQYSLEEKRASQAKDRADHEKTVRDWERYQDQFAKKTITEAQLDAHRAAYEKSVVQQAWAQSLVKLAEANVEAARNMLNVARNNLKDTVVTAPLDGVVTLRAMEPGQNARPGDCVIRIDNPSALEATGFLSGQIFDRVRPGIRVLVSVEGHEPVWRRLTYKAPAVDQGLRTFKIKVDMDGDGDGLVPGLLAEMGVALREERGTGVPRTALVQRGDRWLVFLVRDGAAAPLEVAPGIESDGWVMVASAATLDGLEVINGHMTLAQLEEGTPVVAVSP